MTVEWSADSWDGRGAIASLGAMPPIGDGLGAAVAPRALKFRPAVLGQPGEGGPLGSNANIYNRATPQADHREALSERQPPVFSVRRAYLWSLAEEGYQWQASRQRRCRKVRIQSNVPVAAYTSDGGDRRACFRGLETCGNATACPLCAARVRSARATELGEQLTAWADHHGGIRSVSLVTLTVAHARADSLGELMRGLARAWNRFSTKVRRRHKGGREGSLAERFGLVHTVRSTEVTHGANGWHPHLHFAWLWESPKDPAELLELKKLLAPIWADCVAATMGEQHRPAFKWGVDFVAPAGATQLEKVAEYLLKLGLEIADPLTKKGRRAEGDETGSSSPFELLERAGKGDGSAGALWVRYRVAMKGRRVFEYSHGASKALRKLAEHGREKSDEELAEDSDRGTVEFELSGDFWRELVSRRGARAQFLRAAELGGADGALAWAARTGIWPPKRHALEQALEVPLELIVTGIQEGTWTGGTTEGREG